MATFSINNRPIGGRNKTYIIAELSCNHNQDKEIALELVRRAAEAGSDAIKLQHYTPDTITIPCGKEYFQIKGETLWDGQTLHALYSKAYTPWEWTSEIQNLAKELGMDLFSSPFDTSAVDFLEQHNVPAYKIASCEITDHVLIKRIAETKKPVIISSGMASKSELQEAVDVLRKYGCTQICMLKCTAEYPAKKSDANLETIRDMMKSFDVVGGLSDHTLGWEVPVGAVYLGASIIEKHFTLSRESGSPDDAFSLEPAEWKEMVQRVREAESIIGKQLYGGVKGEEAMKTFRRSLFVVKPLKKGEKITEEQIRSIRPGHGCHTKHFWDLLGKVAVQDVEYGEPMKLEYAEGMTNGCS